VSLSPFPPFLPYGEKFSLPLHIGRGRACPKGG
jgi:hypothetical protein